MDNEVKQFDSISDKYSSFVDIDPIRNFLHYPAVINLLGNIDGKNILDIGCGDGFFDRKLAKEFGAIVVGYDKAPDLIKIAKDLEKENYLGVEYFVDDPLSFKGAKVFDDSLSVMVLPYSPDKDYLINFFTSAHQNMKEGGRFISVIFNPLFTAFDKNIANRIFKLKDGKVEVNFMNPKREGEIKFKALLNQYLVEDYEAVAKESGFQKISWSKLYPTKEGIELCGIDFWRECEDKQPYIVLVVEK